MIRRGIFLILIAVGLTTCTQTPQEDLTQTTFALGTVITINLFDQGNQALMDQLIRRVGEIEALMSSQKEDSEISEVTHMAGIEPVSVSAETYEVIERALYYADLSDGRFDPTIGPIIQLWGIGTEEARLPEQVEIDEALKFVDYQQVVLKEADSSVYLPVKGMSLDLGGIAKGYAADKLVEILDASGVDRAMINLGGNIYAYGEKEDGSAYKIAIQTPYDTRNTYFGYAELKDKTVVTSGPYERYFEEEGTVYHHIFNANTGYPIQSEVASVSIVASTSMDADALSTLLFTMTPEEGLALIETMVAVECVYVDKDDRLTLSSGLLDLFTLTDDQYQMK